MKDQKKTCSCCQTILEYLTRCDYCGAVIPEDAVFHNSLTITETDPENSTSYEFDFCDCSHMTKWMQERKPEMYEGRVSGTTFYTWVLESENKFQKNVSAQKDGGTKNNA